MSTLTAAAFIAALVIAGVDRMGLLDWIKPKSAADAVAELELRDRTIERLRTERNAALDKAAELQRTRSLEPILDQLAENSRLQAQVIDRLAAHNGSFAHMEKALGTVADGLKALMGTIAELHDIPLKNTPPG